MPHDRDSFVWPAYEQRSPDRQGPQMRSFRALPSSSLGMASLRGPHDRDSFVWPAYEQRSPDRQGPQMRSFRALQFIRAHTQLQNAPLVPEFRLHLAEEVTPLWLATEEAFGPQEPPFWGFAWPGSQALARWILDNPMEIAGKSVVDIGTGCGLAAIAAVKGGAASVIANDVQELALAAAALNASENGVEVGFHCGDWIGTELAAEVVLVGDLCYDQKIATKLLPWLQELARGRRVILAEPGRAFAPRAGVRAIGHYTVPTLMDLESRSERGVVLLEIEPG